MDYKDDQSHESTKMKYYLQLYELIPRTKKKRIRKYSFEIKKKKACTSVVCANDVSIFGK